MDIKSIQEATDYINSMVNIKPVVGLVLGSGLGVLADEIKQATIIPFSDIPYFPESTVIGHKGQLVIGSLEGKIVMAMQGRFHFYEGYSMKQVTFPIRVMKQLGINVIIVTNAAGGINREFNAGDLMIITDHINNMGTNALIGPNNNELGPRFPDMSSLYDLGLIEHASDSAEIIGLKVKKGIYVGNTGPVYETPAEIKMLRAMGADAVGMSTVPEVTVAGHARIKVLGISCISNMAAGILEQPLSHNEVIETTDRVKDEFLQFIRKIISTLPL